MGSYFFQPHILQPTRITNHSATLIDNIFFNSTTHHAISGNITYELTDHLPNFIIINKFTTLPKNVVIYKRDFSNFNEPLLVQDIQETDWNYDNDACNCDVNSMFDEFHSKLSATIDKHASLKQLGRRSIKNLSNPWVTSGIRNAIRVKNKLYKEYIKTRLLYYYSKLKMHRNKINHLIKINKISYYNRYFTLHKSSIKNIWKGIREIVNLKPMNFNLPSKLLKDGNEINNSKDINHTCPIPLQDVQWTFECPLDISVRPLDEWTSEFPLDISVCPMDEWTFECRMDISVRPLVEWTYECPMDISLRPMVEWTFVYVQWTLLIFNTKYDNAGNAFCLLKAIMN